MKQIALFFCVLALGIGIAVVGPRVFASDTSKASDVAATTTKSIAADPSTVTVKTQKGTFSFDVELARSVDERATGLMNRRSMDEKAGMLFDFHSEEPIAMWMKNTFIPLDMIFIRADGKVARIAENTEPHSETIIPSYVPVRYVLEVNAGVSFKIGLEPGDMLKHPWFNKK